MKRIILLILMVLPISAMASIPEFSAIIERYTNNDEVTTMTMDKAMIGMFAQDVEGIESIDKIDMVITENKSIGETIINEMKQIVEERNAERLLSTKTTEEEVKLYALKDGDSYSHIILIISDDTQMGAIVISGTILEEQFDKLVQVQM